MPKPKDYLGHLDPRGPLSPIDKVPTTPTESQYGPIGMIQFTGKNPVNDQSLDFPFYYFLTQNATLNRSGIQNQGYNFDGNEFEFDLFMANIPGSFRNVFYDERSGLAGSNHVLSHHNDLSELELIDPNTGNQIDFSFFIDNKVIAEDGLFGIFAVNINELSGGMVSFKSTNTSFVTIKGGPYACPPIVVYKVDANRYHPKLFYRGNHFYVPLLLPDHSICYFATEDRVLLHEYIQQVQSYNPGNRKMPVAAVRGPISYENQLKIHFTKNVDLEFRYVLP